MALFERDGLGPDYPDNSGRHILIDCIQCDYTSNKNNGQTVLKKNNNNNSYHAYIIKLTIHEFELNIY